MGYIPLLLVFAGLAVGVVGYLGLIERLPRNNIAGVRTRSTMRSDAAFRVANKAAGVPTLAGGIVALAGGVVGWFVPAETGLAVVVIVVLVCVLVLVIIGAMMGVRAAGELPDRD